MTSDTTVPNTIKLRSGREVDMKPNLVQSTAEELCCKKGNQSDFSLYEG